MILPQTEENQSRKKPRGGDTFRKAVYMTVKGKNCTTHNLYTQYNSVSATGLNCNCEGGSFEWCHD